jgi:hypothetical protein
MSRVREGLQPLSGTLRLGFEGERTLYIPFDAEASQMKQASLYHRLVKLISRATKTITATITSSPLFQNWEIGSKLPWMTPN